ncbi:cupin domain-containing protein [Chelativorans alearense]|uniref:cupin domain-containing protein n=1 Tax=Chelativorans alearense TaxID=2681495 RepID=UPI0013D7821F|nr:cupin domain-containing protein [Chelativorans alearense]
MTLSRSCRISPSALYGAVALGALLALSVTPVPAGEAHHTAITEDQVEWQPGPPTLPAGAQIAVLHGNPAEEGQFVFRLKFPAGYVIAPHRHLKEEHVTVVSGGFGMATGETYDRSTAPILPPGSFVRIPVGTAHFAWADEETVVQLNGIGPFGVEYVNPKDDPRTN